MSVSVLVVVSDSHLRERVASWVWGANYEVLMCCGPQSPAFLCLGSRGGVCSHAEAADVVVLDLLLGSDVAMKGTPSWQLLDYYRGKGKPVIALSHAESVSPWTHDDVIVLRWPADRKALLEAIKRAISSPTGDAEEDVDFFAL